MMIKLLGAAMIVLGCGTFGARIAYLHRRQVHSLEQLITAIDYLSGELIYKMTPLPELCFHTAGITKGPVSLFFLKLSENMKKQISPHVKTCAQSALAACQIPEYSKQVIHIMADTLGLFDLDGQLKGLQNARQKAELALRYCTRDQNVRLRSYQTLSLCAGAALAILFI